MGMDAICVDLIAKRRHNRTMNKSQVIERYQHQIELLEQIEAKLRIASAMTMSSSQTQEQVVINAARDRIGWVINRIDDNRRKLTAVPRRTKAEMAVARQSELIKTPLPPS